MTEIKVEILKNTEVKKGIFNIVFKAASLAKEAKAGQFVYAKVEGQGAPLLRRAFGIYKADAAKGTLEILFKVLGPGTEILSRKKAGELVSIIGPCGNGFDIKKGKKHLVVSGGMGVAPLMFLTQKLIEAGEEVYSFLGAKTENELLCSEEFGKMCSTVFITTDDGTAGERCFVNVPLETMLKTAQNAVIYSCGPHPMLKCIAGLGEKYKCETQVSLEEKMGCAVGVCQGCPVEVKGKDTKYKMVCKDGPVFNAEDIVW